MNEVLQRPIGHPSPLSPAALDGLVMTPRVTPGDRGVREEVDSKRWAALAKLEPLDADAASTPAVNIDRLDDDAVADIARLSADLDEAVRLAVAAEQAHTAALRIAKTLPHLLDKSSQLSARAICGGKADMDALAANNAKIDEARIAESALRTLANERDEAARYRDGSFGRLRVRVNKAVAAMRLRAAAEYARLVDALRVCVASIDCSIELQTRDIGVQSSANGWHAAIGLMRLPALPAEYRGTSNGVEHHTAGGDVLLSFNHGFLVARQKAVKHRLQQQIERACRVVGLQHHNLL